MDSDSETELELAVGHASPLDISDTADSGKGEPILPEPTTDETPALDSLLASPSQPAPTSSSSTFLSPPVPTLAHDLTLIMEMVASGDVVGSLPPIDMPAAEKRKLVEQSIRDKAKAKSLDLTPEAPETAIEIESDSSSEFESDSASESDSNSDSDSEGIAGGPPMTEAEHRVMKQQLEEFMQEGGTEPANEMRDSSSKSVLDHMAIDYTFCSDDEDEFGETSISGPITSVHEVTLPPVPQPPVAKLPADQILSLAGDVVSWMRDKQLEAWLERQAAEARPASDVVEKNNDDSSADSEKNGQTEHGNEETKLDDSEAKSAEAGASTTALEVSKGSSLPTPKFSSAGTLIVRAMQSRPGSGDDGWLEEGSVLCFEDGRVLGVVAETFGPLTSPFYQVRLPPPPHPYPFPGSLSAGTRVFYPASPMYRSFVNMHAVRDPRFKGSDASNVYDEEIGEDEVEWSDDEAEAEAKRRKKAKRSGSRASSRAPSASPAPSRSGAPTHHSLPPRPHFDYAPETDHAASETTSMYGDDGDDGADGWDNMSDTGSTTSSRARTLPAPYDIDDSTPMSNRSSQPQGGRGGRGRDRNDRGGRGRGRGGGQGRTTGPGRGNAPSHSLPPRPNGSRQTWEGLQGGYPFPHSPALQRPPPPFMAPYFSYAPYQPTVYDPNSPALVGTSFRQGYPPGFVPVANPGGPPPPIPGQLPQPPAINPRFAAQYRQLMEANAEWRRQQEEGGPGGYSE